VKNLEGSLEALKDTDPSYRFIYDVYGMHDNAAYYERCRSLAASMPSHVSVSFMGGIKSSETAQALSRYHFFYMLTGNENFGHAILEALTAGCPVIISDKTPWRSISREKAGWDLNPSDKNAVVAVLNRAASMDQETYNEWSEASRIKSEFVHRSEVAIREHEKMFNSAIHVNQVSEKIS
jgi:glycosyltransferase involved in cell wall biosynthesis